MLLLRTNLKRTLSPFYRSLRTSTAQRTASTTLGHSSIVPHKTGVTRHIG